MGVWFKVGLGVGGLWVWGFACRDVISGLLVQQLKLSSLRVCGEFSLGPERLRQGSGVHIIWASHIQPQTL